MKALAMLCYCALLISAFSGPCVARVATGTLEGTVLDARGRPIPGATVTIQTSDGVHPHVTRHTGMVQVAISEFVRFAVGQYDLRAYLNGSYSDWAKRIAIRSKQPASVTLQIKSSMTFRIRS